jgi:hypothetical protein
MHCRKLVLLLSLASVLGLDGCFFSGSDQADDGVLGGALSVEGSFVDFGDGSPIASGVSLLTSGLDVAPKIEVQDATFRILDIPENSSFQLLASAPLYRPTYSPTVTLLQDNLTEVAAPLVRDSFIATLVTAFGVNPTAARGVLLARLVDVKGAPRAGVAASNLVLSGGPGVTGPRFLDATMKPTPAATVSSASGWVVFFEVSPGVASLSQAATATVTLDMAISPINAGSITISEIKVTDGPPSKFTNVSFENQIVPIFSARGCVGCHSGNGPGKDLGGLTLNGSPTKIYKELLTEDPTRVRSGLPETSLLLTMPSREAPPDRHPNVTFASATDADFQKIFVWIKEGAKEN